jgi:hypothetical protein
VRRALVPEGPSLCPEPEARTPRSDAATETDSDVGSETPQGYKALVGMYAGVRIGQSPELEVDASADEVSEADTTPRAKASQSSPSPEEERRREKEEPRPSRAPPPRGGGADDVSARDALFSTSSGGDARAPDSDSWKPEGAFDPAVSGRRARRSEKELEEELERGVRRLEKGGESLAAAGRLADEANAGGRRVARVSARADRVAGEEQRGAATGGLGHGEEREAGRGHEQLDAAGRETEKTTVGLTASAETRTRLRRFSFTDFQN